MQEIKVTVPDGKRAEWKEINGEQALVLVDVKDNRPVTERIKTFEDAVEELGESNPLVSLYRSFESDLPEKDESDKDVLAFIKLRIVVAALNEGWVPTFEKDEYRWFPWYYIYTKEEVDAMDEDEKRRVVGRAHGNAGPGGGCVYAYAGVDSANSGTSGGARLAFRDRERAEYAGRQFAELYVRLFFDADFEKL